jgi:hypothetical protein
MGKPFIKESFPGSGVTKAGTRINPDMDMEYAAKLPFVIEKIRKAKESFEKFGNPFAR